MNRISIKQVLIGIFTILMIVLNINMAHAQQDILLGVDSAYKAKDYRQVIDAIQAYIKEHQALDSVQQKLLHLKARAYVQIQEYDSSYYTYVDIFKKYPSDRITLIHLGYMFGESGKYYSAFYFLEKLRKYHPTDPVGTLNLSYYHNELGIHEKAIAYADSTLQLAQDSVTIGVAWNNRCYANIRLGRLPDAMLDLRNSMAYYPKNSYAYKNLALIQLEVQNNKKACEALNMAQQLGGVRITQEFRKECCEPKKVHNVMSPE